MAKLSGATPQGGGTTNGSAAGAHAKVTIYYNPKCRKSREALQIIKEKGIDPEIRNYMEEPPSKAELSEVLRKMGRRPTIRQAAFLCADAASAAPEGNGPSRTADCA